MHLVLSSVWGGGEKNVIHNTANLIPVELLLVTFMLLFYFAELTEVCLANT